MEREIGAISMHLHQTSPTVKIPVIPELPKHQRLILPPAGMLQRNRLLLLRPTIPHPTTPQTVMFQIKTIRRSTVPSTFMAPACLAYEPSVIQVRNYPAQLL